MLGSSERRIVAVPKYPDVLRELEVVVYVPHVWNLHM